MRLTIRVSISICCEAIAVSNESPVAAAVCNQHFAWPASTDPITAITRNRSFRKPETASITAVSNSVGADPNRTYRADPILTRGWMPTA